MNFGRPIERRQARQAGLRLEHSFLFRIPPRVAWAVTVSALCVVVLVEFFAPREIWFGPFYLAVLALAAWSLGSITAVVIGLAILSIKFAAGGMYLYPYGSDLVLSNLAARMSAVAVVVGFIGIARKSCEMEWRRARTDPLTGAFNRQAFFEIVRGDQGSGGWSAIIYADLDGLKRLNDEEGHDQGDQSLKAFADTVKRTIRKDDVFARMGGDEFVIFMKLKNEEAGAAVASRLHEAINLRVPEGVTHLQCSLGILLLEEGSKSIDAELRAADELMYQAKKSRQGIYVASATVEDGKMILSPSVSVVSLLERDSMVRQTDRPQAVPKANSAGRVSPRPKSRAA